MSGLSKVTTPGLSTATATATYAPIAPGITFAGRPLQVVTDRFALTVSGLLSNGTDTGQNGATAYPLTRDVSVIHLVAHNIADWASSASPNSITARFGVGPSSTGPWTAVYFGGKRDIVIDADGLPISDAVGIVLTAGSNLWVRSRVTVNSGEKWPWSALCDSTIGEGEEQSTTTTDKTTTGTVTAFAFYTYSPYTILAPAVTGTKKTLVGCGDSIMQEQHDDTTGPTGGKNFNWGFLRRYAYANRIPFLNVGVIGDTAQAYAAGGSRKYSNRLSLASNGAVVVNNFGINDLVASRTLAQVQADLLTIWNAQSRTGAKVYQCTITPKTSSTDNWATTAGQTKALPDDTIRTALNDWIRTTPTPLSGYVETADTVETARNSGIWQAQGRNVSDAAITASATSLTSATAAFTSADTGMTVVVAGAGAAGAALSTTLTYVNATTVTLATAAGTTVSGAVANIRAKYTTDDGLHPKAPGHVAMSAATGLAAVSAAL